MKRSKPSMTRKVSHYTSSIPYKTIRSCTLISELGLDMHSIFCCLESGGLFNEAPLGLVHAKSPGDSVEIVLFLKANSIVNKHPITQLSRFIYTVCVDDT